MNSIPSQDRNQKFRLTLLDAVTKFEGLNCRGPAQRQATEGTSHGSGGVAAVEVELPGATSEIISDADIPKALNGVYTILNPSDTFESATVFPITIDGRDSKGEW